MKPTLLDRGIWIALGLTLLAPCAGRAEDKPEMALRQRAHSFCDRALASKFEEMVDLVDPAIVEAQGKKEVRKNFENFLGIIKGTNALFGRKLTSFTIQKVELNKEKNQATLHIVFYSAGVNGSDRKEHPGDQTWVLNEKKWYWHE